MSERAIDPLDLRRALGTFATGVTVVTTVAADGTPRGFTANSFTSVSLEPPLILVCLAKSAASCPVFQAPESYAVNILFCSPSTKIRIPVRTVSSIEAKRVPSTSTRNRCW